LLSHTRFGASISGNQARKGTELGLQPAQSRWIGLA
jgi:hypothetical protein